MAVNTWRWVLDEAQQGLTSLHFQPSSTLSSADTLGPGDVLVEIHAASLNYRDLVIAKVSSLSQPRLGHFLLLFQYRMLTVSQGKIPGGIQLHASPNVVPGSDGAGTVVAVGSEVDWLKAGDHVVTHMVKRAATTTNDHMPSMADDISHGLGQELNGTLCRQGIFHETCLIPMPNNMSFEEAATLTCSALTAWNALMGLPSMAVKKGDWILVQGTGGVSVAALQVRSGPPHAMHIGHDTDMPSLKIAVAAGANVIAITSSNPRSERLQALGAKHVINYRAQPKWGEIAKSFTPEQRGVDHVVDVVGSKTLGQSLAAIRVHGLITIAGMVGGAGDEQEPGIMSAMWRHCMFRGIILGSRTMFLDMVKFMEEKNIKPAVDDVSFDLKDAKAAYERLERQDHFSKVIITMK